jgi:hypothetical protein
MEFWPPSGNLFIGQVLSVRQWAENVLEVLRSRVNGSELPEERPERPIVAGPDAAGWGGSANSRLASLLYECG